MPPTLLLLLFFASGASGLVYEVVWMRLLALTLSVTVYAVATVLCAFMAGLALGAAVGGRLADRLRRPLVAYGIAELGIAATAVVAPAILFALGPAYVWMHDRLGGTGIAFTLGRFLLAFGVLLVPCTLMGATLPLLSRAVVAGRDTVGRGTGALYAINTLGAVAGCLGAGFVLVPSLGLTRTTFAAAAVNALVGVIAIVLGRRGVAAAPAPAGGRAAGLAGAWVACLVFGLSGFTAMGYQILWTRALEPFAHNSTYAYSAMLATFLLGLGVGSAAAAAVADRVRRPLVALGAVEIAIGASVVAALLVYARFGVLVPAVARGLGGLTSWPRAMALIFGEAGVTLLVTTFLFGATFPLVARAVVDSLDRLGTRIAAAYTANTVGAIAGSLVVGFLVLPALGMGRTFVALVLMNVALGAALVVGAARGVARVSLGAAAGVVALGTLVLVPPQLFEDGFRARFGKLLFYREEVTDTVMVTEDARGERMIRYGDGRGTAGTFTVREDRMYSHLAMMLHPAPRRVLSICFGVGNSLGALLVHPVERVDAVELSPGVVDAAPFFRSTNRDPLADPRVRLTVQDGRNFLLASRHTYDVIRLDPPELHTAGVVNLYTREFFELARSHLAPGGIFSLWVNIVMTPEADMRTLVRTVASVFPHVTVWHGPFRYSWVINASMDPQEVDLLLLTRRFADPAVRADLESIGVADPYAFLSHFVLGGAEEVATFAGSGPLVVDDHTRLDFSVPRSIDSFFGIANANTDHWLVQLMDPDSRGDVAVGIFLRKVAHMAGFKRPVVPHVVNLEALGLDREGLRARLDALPAWPPRATAAPAPVGPGGDGAQGGRSG